jgi:hypothetical protein
VPPCSCLGAGFERDRTGARHASGALGLAGGDWSHVTADPRPGPELYPRCARRSRIVSFATIVAIVGRAAMTLNLSLIC